LKRTMAPTLSTPASPTPLTEDGDDLLLELRGFLSRISSGSTGYRPQYQRDSASALRLLRHLPASRFAVLDFFSGIVDVEVADHLSREEIRSGRLPSGGGPPPEANRADLDEALNLLESTLSSFVEGFEEREVGGAGKCPPSRSHWAPIVAKWAIKLLGDVSSKFASRVVKLSGTGDIRGTLPYWLGISGTRILMSLTTQCITSLRESEWHEETEICVSGLLDASMKHGPAFDWVVAHVGARFPDTVIARVFSVGLRDFWSACGDDQTVTESGQVNLAKIPKISSVVSILDHLAWSADHLPDVVKCLKTMVCDSIEQYDDDDIEAGSEEEEQSLATVPYLLYLASMSDVVAMALTNGVYEFVTRPGVAERLSEMVADWAEHYFPGTDALPNHMVNLLMAIPGVNGRDAVRLLFDLGGDMFESNTRAARDAVHGCRLTLELMLCDLLAKVHQNSDTPPILKAIDESFVHSFVRPYMLSDDPFQRKCMLILANIMALHKGRSVALDTLKHCLANANDTEHIGSILIFVKDNEGWSPDLLKDSVAACLKRPTAPFLNNVCALLELQAKEEGLPDNLTTVTQIEDCLTDCHLTLLEFGTANKQCFAQVLKIFHHVPLPKTLSVTQMHKICRHLVRSLFVLLEERQLFSEEERLRYTSQIVDLLSSIVATQHIACLNITIRCLIESALKSRFSVLFGSRVPVLKPKPKPVSLFEENLKFGAMPAHPLGASTVFHAGVIGEGKRPPPPNRSPSKEIVEENSLTFVSFLFKLCHNFAAAGTNTNGGGKNPREKEQMRERSREACKQMALLLNDLVSPDLMYNGLPWPIDEEFAKVTVERDLVISKRFEEHPILWRILAGLAEARPALCYCSVLLRALLAVEMSHWQTSVVSKSSQSPKHLEVTVKVLRLLSLGQFVPPPLDSVGDVLHVMHPFHVHCILSDMWTYLSHNVPSPMSFTLSSSDGGSGALCREFEPYKNYRKYCERLRLIMIRHIAELPHEFKKFFVDVSDRQEKMHENAMKIAMEY